jgi:hypothetical protein
MATDLGTRSVSVKTSERTSAFALETRFGQDPRLVIQRERLCVDGGGNVLSATAARTVIRLASRIGAEQVALASGTVITIAQLAEALPLFFDRWAGEDIKAAAGDV